MLTSWALPTVGIFMVDNNLLKIIFGAMLVGNYFLGGSASGAKMMMNDGTMTRDQWMMWESINTVYKIAIAVASTVMIAMA